MTITADSITLSFLVVSAVTLAVVSVLVWYVYSSRKFKKDIIDLMDKKLETYLIAKQQPNEETPKEAEEKQTEPQEGEKELVGELPNIEINE